MDCSVPGFSVPHHLPKFAQVHVHCISDAIQTSHPLMPSSPSVLSLSQHQVLFQWVSISDQDTAASTLVLVSCSISPSNEYWGLISLKTGLISFLSKGLSGVISSTTVSNSLAPCLLYGPALTTVCDHWEDQSLIYRALSAEQCLCFSMHCLDLSWLSCQEAIVFWFHGCSHHP